MVTEISTEHHFPLLFFSVYLIHTCNWCRKHWQDMTQKHIQAYPSTFTYVSSQEFAAEGSCIALNVTATCTKNPQGLLNSCKWPLPGHSGAFCHDGKQPYLLRHWPVMEDPTPQVLPLLANKSKAYFCDVPSPQRGVQPKENTILPLKNNLFPWKKSIPQRTGVSHLS